MSLPKEIQEEILNDLIKEMESLPGKSEAKTFDDIEKQVLEIRQKLGQKLMEATIKNQGSGKLTEKKTVKNVEQDSETMD